MNVSEHKSKGHVLLVLHDRDIFTDEPNLKHLVWRDRLTGKVVLFNDDSEIAVIANKINDFVLLPGGGIEGSESIISGTKRECQEETGCVIEIQDELGVTEDFRARESKHCISYGYTAKVISYGVPKLTESELDIGIRVKWIPLAAAVTLFATQEEKVKAGEVRFYNTCFNIFRDSLFVRQAQYLIQTKKHS